MKEEIEKNYTESKVRLEAGIRDVPNFPKEGITFKDITPLLANPSLRRYALDLMATKMLSYGLTDFNTIAGIESRGFLFGMALSEIKNVPFVLVRKENKLPHKKVSLTYELEYGSSVIEMHEDSIKPGDSVIIHDDLLATGGTAIAAGKLIEQLGGKVAGFVFLIDLTFLSGVAKIQEQFPDAQIVSLLHY